MDLAGRRGRGVVTGSIRVDGNTLLLGDGVHVRFIRTLRLPESGTHALPPNLGEFPLRRVEDYPDTVPGEWLAKGGVMLPVYLREAMWLSFAGTREAGRAPGRRGQGVRGVGRALVGAARARPAELRGAAPAALARRDQLGRRDGTAVRGGAARARRDGGGAGHRRGDHRRGPAPGVPARPAGTGALAGRGAGPAAASAAARARRWRAVRGPTGSLRGFRWLRGPGADAGGGPGRPGRRARDGAGRRRLDAAGGLPRRPGPVRLGAGARRADLRPPGHPMRRGAGSPGRSRRPHRSTGPRTPGPDCPGSTTTTRAATTSRRPEPWARSNRSATGSATTTPPGPHAAPHQITPLGPTPRPGKPVRDGDW